MPDVEMANDKDKSQDRPLRASDDSEALTQKDALNYVDTVKQTFIDQPTVHNNFLDIMRDFKSGR